MGFYNFYTNCVNDIRERTIKLLTYVGEKGLNEIRRKGSYTDRTRNLRGSTGYVIAENGTIIKSGTFSPLPGGTTEGPAQGEQYAKDLAKKYPRGLVLIFVAGMDYALYVQDKGFDVITSGETFAEKEIPRLLKRLKSQNL